MVKVMFVDLRERQKRQGQKCKMNNAKNNPKNNPKEIL